MMAGKYSPGKWELTKFPANIDRNHTFYRLDAKTTLLIDIVECADGFVEGENEANAYLLWSAPDLLEALLALGAQGEPGYCFCRTQEQADNGHTGECKQANAAISKALNTKGN